ncbi:MAG: CHASE4 domain-containing protein [Spirochaetota bacterium]
MSLRGRTISTFLFAFAISTLTAILVSRYFFLQGFADIEVAESGMMLTHAQALIDDDLDQLEVIVRDWAVWDDSYDFINNGTEEYILSNLQESTFEGLGLSGFFIFDDDASLVYAYELDEALGTALAGAYTAPGIWQSVSRQQQSGQHTASNKQLVRLSNGLYLAVGHTIQPTDGLGPGSGLLVMVRALDQARTSRYARLLGTPVNIQLHDKGQEPVESIRKSDGFIIASLPLHTNPGHPVGTLSIEIPRTISEFGARSLGYYLVTVIATLGAIALVSLYILETMVFRQLRSIGSQLDRIASGSDPTVRVQVPQGDEIGMLAGMMNRSLDALQTRIDERETILREVHHRVKNNLQIIASLLNLQAIEMGDPVSIRALSEGRRRVLAMAFIHDELYSGMDLSMIDLGHFISGFSRFFEPEKTSYGAIARRLKSDKVSINIDQAVPIGLVLSEALANCYQHAFPDGRDGSVAIEARAEGTTGITIEVRDDGVGLGSDAPHRSGLGLSLINALADQLHGKVSLTTPPGGGTVLRLRIPRGGTASRN